LIAPDGVVEMAAADEGGAPIAGLSVAAVARRPASEGNDSMLELREVAPGLYRADSALPLSGNWNIVIDATLAGEPYHIERKVYVAP
jgi:nitrogen fixation protein FixH